MKGCKNCPAYAKCTVTYRGSACAVLRSTYGIATDPEISTHAARIRDMSDEELALQFGANCPKENRRACDRMCSKCWLEWLRQPSEEGT